MALAVGLSFEVVSAIVEQDHTSSPTSFLDEDEWSELIWNIRNRQVIPIIGRELITFPHPDTGKTVTLHQYLAPRLATRLKMPRIDYTAVDDVVRDYLMSGGLRKNAYVQVALEMKEFSAPLSEALKALATIDGFDLFLSSTFDSQLSKALEAERIDYDPRICLTRFHPSKPKDIEMSSQRTHLFHILGDFTTFPDFALWEEDHMEFVCGLLEKRESLRELFSQLKNRHLLFLGTPASDWIVRFLLRAARQERLSTRSGEVSEYLNDHEETMGVPMVLFFDKMIQASHVLRGGPEEFVKQLSTRWHAEYGNPDVSQAEFLENLGKTMPHNSIFISYASEDRDAAITLAMKLHHAGISVWLDKSRLEIGQNYEAELEGAVREQASFFISLISETTEADTERKRFVHRERDWAAKKHVDGWVFYLPVVIYPTVERGTREPEVFQKIHHDVLPGGEPTKPFIEKLKQWQESLLKSGRPRR